jgi:hypothetical protein
MSFDVTALSAYIEDQDFPLLAQMQATGDLAEFANIQTGIKGSSHLQFLNTDVVFQADACSRSASDTSTFTQRTLTVGAIQINEDLCTKDLNGYWTQTMVQMGARGEEVIPGAVESVWMEDKINSLKNALALADIQGDTASGTNNLSYYDGLLKLVDADGTVLTGNTGSETDITASNVINILQAMWLVLPDNMMGMDNVSFLLGWDTYQLYVNALIDANLYHFKGEDGITTLHGTNVRLRPMTGFTGTKRIILTNDSNLYVGMDGEGDEDNLDVWYSKDDRVNKLNIAFKRGIQYAFGNQIVEFTKTIS